MRVVFLFVILQMLSASLRAQLSSSLLERYNMSSLDLTSGLPHDHVNHIFVDSQGFVWVSSYGGGAVRYDGYTFQAPHQGDSRSCLGFAEDRHQRLWIAYDEGTVVMDLKTMRRIIPSYGKGTIGGLLGRATVKVYCDSKGALWQVARDSIFRYGFDDDGNVASISRCRYTGNTPDIAICDIEHTGNVWVSTSLGLSRLIVVGDKLKFTPVHTVLQTLKGFFVTDMLRQGSTVWIATNQGLYAYSLYNSTLKAYLHTADERSLAHNHATCLALTSDGNLLVGTLRGICLFDSSRSDFSCWNSSTEGYPLPTNFIRCMLNYQGQLWVGTETAGIVRLLPKPLLLNNYVHQPNNPQSLSPNPVNAMYVSGDGLLWVGNVEGGLSRRMPDGSFLHWTTANSALSHNSVSVFEPDDRGRLWIGTWGGGVNTITVNREPITINRIVLPADFQRQTNYIGALAYDKYHDAMWIGSNDGIFLYDLKTGNIEDPFPDNRNIRGCIGACIDRRGHLWMGCLTGVCDIDLRSGRIGQGNFAVRHLRHKLDKPYSAVVDKITCVVEAKDGTLWIGSNEYGIYHLTTDKEGKPHYQNYNMQHGLVNNGVKGIVEDHSGTLWITTKNGLSQFNPQTGVFNNYTEEDGLPNSQFYWNSAIINKQGFIFLGTNSGLCMLHGINNEASYKGHLRFTHLNIDNRDITADGKYLEEDISQAKKLTMHENDKALIIEFSALDYGNEHNGIYSYRMKGFENEWIKLPMGQHSIRYTSLPGGNYTLEVKYASALSDKEEITQLDIEVIPYFWKRWWFVSGFFILLIVGGAWLYRKRMEQVREKTRKQEAEKAMAPIVKALNESNDPKQLQQRIESILHIQKQYEESYNKSAEENKEDTKKKNKPFMEKVIRILEQNYSNSEFGVTELCEAMNMSRPLLSRRLNEEAGLPTTQFIRNYRLNIAKQLLQESGGRNITEIAYSVGFNDPKYFTRCFTKLYGVSPSATQ